MENNKFLAKLDEFDPSDYVKADVVSFFFDRESGLFEVSKEKDKGDIFFVYLVKKYDEGVEFIGTFTSYDEAKQLVDKLTDWLSEDDWESLIDDDGWGW
jgi:hypothetical protein